MLSIVPITIPDQCQLELVLHGTKALNTSAQNENADSSTMAVITTAQYTATFLMVRTFV